MPEDDIHHRHFVKHEHVARKQILLVSLELTGRRVEFQQPVDRFGKPTGRTPKQQLRYNWTAEVPIYARAMIKAADKLVLCGPEKIIDEKGVVPRYPEKSVLRELEEQQAILDEKVRWADEEKSTVVMPIEDAMEQLVNEVGSK